MRPIARAAWLAAVAVLALAPAEVAAEPKQPAAPAPPRTHVVASGDTLSGIAARYKVTVAGIVAANRLAGERVVLRLGQRLVIPAAAPAAAPATAASAPSTPRRAPRLAAARAEASVPPPRVKPPARGPRGLELEVPEFVEVAPPFTWPVEGPVTSTFGRRRSGWHRGIDIKASEGSVIFAAAAGVVTTSAVEPRYGRVVKIEHDDGYLTVYAHNTENLVQAGMRVAAGDPIATIGRTGRATAHHLHFEIRRNGSVYNPLFLLPSPPRVGQVEEGQEPDEEHE
jgi:murein DD-endopeptidase MepM/ murein hydrolase activator NlpD